ncbi:fibrohexamerin-like [Helicoverpa zea]|uniref:fibrohexamerin-like n=1 Tax=Helicoverpa zea TaxID=7113 RepID=UPI001F5663A8|nr:fibrohexamerin-like [Helicoverpa zea]
MAKVLVIFSVAVVFSTVQAEIVRPCKLSDYSCIGKNLAANSNCQLGVSGALPSKYNVDEFRFETPYFNSSYIDRNLIVRNHHKCFVSEFFFNTVTNKAVLAIDCPKLDLESDRVLIQHHSLQEDTYYNYHIRATYPLIRITVNLPSRTHMDLCRAHVFTDVTALPYMHINPKDKPTKNYLSRDLTLLNIFEREWFYYGGDNLAKIFIDALVCDYGCNRQILPHYSNV